MAAKTFAMPFYVWWGRIQTFPFILDTFNSHCILINQIITSNHFDISNTRLYLDIYSIKIHIDIATYLHTP